MKTRFRRRALLLCLACLAGSSTQAQSLKTSEALELSGVLYMDYWYALQAPSGSAGANGFTYRRVYLTSDYKLNADMRVRARLEANAGSTNEDGKPAPFVKDLYFRWDDALGDGHRLTIGIASPPAFGVSEGFLDYRSLEKTILDRNQIVSSRDFGVKLSGPLGGLKYAVMVGNNSSNKRETNRQKRAYGQIEASPVDGMIMTLGADYAALPGGHTMTANAFAGYEMERVRFGVEGYVSPVRPEDPTEELDRFGVSVFAAATLSDEAELVARYDASSVDDGTETTDSSFLLLGLSWTARENVRFIPNLLVDNRTGWDQAGVVGRVTLHVDF